MVKHCDKNQQAKVYPAKPIMPAYTTESCDYIFVHSFKAAARGGS